MTKTIAKKDLYRQLKMVSDDVVQNGTIYTVIQNSKPSFWIGPMGHFQEKKKYKKEDLLKFVFHSKHPEEKDLARNYKKYLYG